MILYDGNARVGWEGYIGWRGFGMLGKVAEKLPKGDYTMYLINRSYKSQVAKVSLNFYWADQAGTAALKK